MLHDAFKTHFQQWEIEGGNQFFFKALGSFRVRYKAKLKNEPLPYWMSYNVTSVRLTEDDLFTPQPLAFTRIVFGTEDEIEKDEEFSSALAQQAIEERAWKEANDLTKKISNLGIYN